MKKIYLLLLILTASLKCFSQFYYIEDFFDNNSPLDTNTDFTVLRNTGDYKLDDETVLGAYGWVETAFYGRKENDSTYYGFTFSNIQDSITQGQSNDRSAYPAIGAEGSRNYAIAHGTNYGGYIDVPIGAKPTDAGYVYHAYIANATITALSMIHGDSTAKKFGGVTGTDPDWLKLTIYSYSYGYLRDSLEVYLADFRSDDSTQDYILKDWLKVDLSLLGQLDSLSFGLSSSDTDSITGMKTPPYFCIDNLKIEQRPGGISSNKKNTIKATIFPNPAIDIINVKTEIAVDIYVYSTTGKLLLSGTNSKKIDVSALDIGAYILKIKARKSNASASFNFIKLKKE